MVVDKACSVPDCGKPPSARGWCDTHYSRWRRRGDPLAPHGNLVSDDALTYRAAHKRLDRVRGKASSHACVDCGGQAAQWSYVGGQPDERRSPKGFPYSANPEAYVPRCVSCHKRLDDPVPIGLAYRWANR